MSKLRKIFCISLSFVMLLSGSTIAQATEATIEIENEYVIVGNEETIENIENDYGGEISEDGLILSDITLTKADVRSIVRENDEVIIEENIMFEGDSSETDETETNSQWYRNAIGVDDIEIPENDIKIALIDSGVSYSDDIPVIDSIKLVDDGNESILFSDASGHGTAMAGIIAAQDNDDGITGINPYADIYSAQVLDSDNRGTLSAILEAINWAVANEVDIINMSFGTSTDSELLHNAIRDAHNAGILIVASAGNSADSAVKYPAAYDEVIAVGGTDTSGNIRTDLTTGDEIDIFAPGEKILSSALLDGVMAIGGTSASAAQVTGVASLLLRKDTSKSPDFIKSLIKASSKVIAESNAGFIDYAYANEIYDDFESMYVPGEIAEYTNETPMENYDEEAEIVVEGLWSDNEDKKGHDDQVDAANTAALKTDSKFESRYFTIISYACLNVDYYYGSKSNGDSALGKKIQAFHGRGNYVANIRFVSNFAQYMRMGDSYSKAIKKCQDKFVGTLLNYNESTGKYTGKNEHGNMMMDMIPAIKDIYDHLDSQDRLYTESSHGPKRRMLVYLGVVLHMIGDVYAHRTIVPEYTVPDKMESSITKGSNHNDCFSTKDFPHKSNLPFDEAKVKDYVKCLNPYDYAGFANRGAEFRYRTIFERAVRLGVVEFQDIIRFETTEDPEKYDDMAEFCSERYNDSLALCKKYLTDVIDVNFDSFDSVVKFDAKYIVPSDDYVKLNNLKKYIENANLSTNDYTASFWNKHSTTEYI